MKITQILYSGLGGQGNVAFSIINGDKHNTYKYHFIFYGVEDLLVDYINKSTLLNAGYDFIKKSIGIDLKSQFKIYQALIKEQPDIVFLHSNTLILPVFFYSLLYRKRLITIEHTPNISKRIIDWIFSWISINLSYRTVLLTKSYFKEITSTLKLIAKSRLKIIPNGLDLQFYSPIQINIPKQPLIVGMQSRITATKDHETLIQAIKTLIDKNIAIQLKIAGEGESLERHKKLVNDLNLNNSVEFTGNLGEHALREFLLTLDIYVHASHSETMSTAIMQALSCGLPIVASDIPGINNLIENGITGILYENKNSKILAKKLAILVKNDSYRIDLGQSARNYALEHLSCEVMFEKYKNLLR